MTSFNNIAFIKSSPYEIVSGDIIINASRVSDVWGIVVKVGEDDFSPPRIVHLSSGRIAKFSTYREKWVAYSPKEYARLMSDPIITRERMWEQIALENSLNEHSVCKVSPGMHLYLLSLHKHVQFYTEDAYELHIVRSMIVAAYTVESAKHIAPTYMHLDDSQSAWNDQRNILCKPIGLAFVNKPQIITVSREDQNG